MAASSVELLFAPAVESRALFACDAARAAQTRGRLIKPVNRDKKPVQSLPFFLFLSSFPATYQIRTD